MAAEFSGVLLDLLKIGNIARGDEREGGECNQIFHAPQGGGRALGSQSGELSLREEGADYDGERINVLGELVCGVRCGSVGFL